LAADEERLRRSGAKDLASQVEPGRTISATAASSRSIASSRPNRTPSATAAG
jgi:hypothetical protein